MRSIAELAGRLAMGRVAAAAQNSSPVPGIHNPGVQCIEIETASAADTVNKEARRPIHAILPAAPKMFINEIMVASGLQLIAEAFDVETDLLRMPVQILRGQGVLIVK